MKHNRAISKIEKFADLGILATGMTITFFTGDKTPTYLGLAAPVYRIGYVYFEESKSN